jgi:hypothetical protein
MELMLFWEGVGYEADVVVGVEGGLELMLWGGGWGGGMELMLWGGGWGGGMELMLWGGGWGGEKWS